MSVELLKTLSLGAFIAAGVLLLIAIALFFVLDVRKLIGDVSGANARKAIENIRQQNENTGDKAYKPSPVNAARGKLTDKITPSGKIVQRSFSTGGSPGTEKFSTTELAPSENETTVLYQDTTQHGATEILQLDRLPAGLDIGNELEFAIDIELSFAGSSELIE